MAEQYAKNEPLVLKRKPLGNGGRNRGEDRHCVEGIPRMFHSGAHGKRLPERYPYAATGSRRLQKRGRAYGWLVPWSNILSQRNVEGPLSQLATLTDGTFSPGKEAEPNSVRRGEEIAQISGLGQAAAV